MTVKEENFQVAVAHSLSSQKGQQSRFTLSGRADNTTVSNSRIFRRNVELKTIGGSGSGTENGNCARSPVRFGKTFGRLVEGNGHSHNSGQITVGSRIGFIRRKLIKESRLRNPALANRCNAEQTADALNFAFAEVYFFHAVAFQNNRHRIFGQRLIIGIAVFN